jgi:hypothetical protein
MLSESASLVEFMDQVRGKQFEDLVFLADREATEAERFLYRQRSRNSEDAKRYGSYATMLKDFMIYLRHGVRTSALRGLDGSFLEEFRNGFSH